ncbi:MAG TPA: hypothetical protein VM143_02700 [Acidimicrobiales bacterium]|nr:hypothetical protein [Acidimicrobiales bacterium]
MPLNPLAPFVDDELVALRAKQRRILADIPDWVVDGLLHGLPTTELPLSTAGGRAEARLRELAREEMVGAHAVLERAGKALAAGEVLDVVHQWVQSAGGDAALLLDEIMTTMRAELADMPGPDDDLRSMHRMVVLLDLADRASTDGYRDPRLDAGPTPGTVPPD